MPWYKKQLTAAEVAAGRAEQIFNAFEPLYFKLGGPQDVAMFQSPFEGDRLVIYFTPATEDRAFSFLRGIGAEQTERPTNDVQTLMIGEGGALAKFRQGTL